MNIFRKAPLLLLSACIALLVAGCSKGENGEPWAVGKTCIDGVYYYASGYQLAPAYNRDGTLKLCGN